MLCCSFCLLVQNGDLDVHPKAPQQLNILQMNGSAGTESFAVTGNLSHLFSKRHAMISVYDLDGPNWFTTMVGHRHTEHLLRAEPRALVYGWIESTV